MIGLRKKIMPLFKNNAFVWQLFATVLMLLLSTIQIGIPLAISKSGSLQIYFSEIILIVIGLALVLAVCLHKISLSVWDKRTLYIALALVAWVFVISIIRFFRGDNALQAWLAIRTTIMPLILYFLYSLRILSAKVGVTSLVLFCFCLNCVQIFSWNNIRMSSFMGNSFVYASIILMILPINLYFLTLKPNRSNIVNTVLKTIAFLNIVISSVFVTLSGSRILIFLMAYSLPVLAIFYHKLRRILLILFAGFATASILIFLVWVYNPLDAAMGIYRIIPPSWNEGLNQTVMSSSLQVTVDQQANSQNQSVLGENSALEIIESEKDKSDSIRFYLWKMSAKSITEDPLIGDGNIYFSFKNDYNVKKQAAHNMILEHWNAYGLLGLMLYLILLLRVIFLKRKFLESGTILAILIIALGSSMFQPTMLIMPFVITLYASVASMQNVKIIVGNKIA